MASKSSHEGISKEQIVALLEDCNKQSDKVAECDTRSPSAVAHFMGPDVRLNQNSDFILYFSLWLISI